MKREIERKYAIQNEQAFLSRLCGLGIKLGDPVTQVDTIYFRAGKSFADLPLGEPIVRIRETEKGATTTLKIYKNGPSDRAEVECGISNPTAFAEYLRCLGLVETVQVKKTRQHAEYKGVRILLDQVDNLGTYAEIEIIASDTEIDDAFQRVNSVARDLQLEHVHIASRPYDEMLHNSMMT